MSDLLPHVLNGLSLGLLFALLALGFMLVVGVMEVINLAHGSLFALGAYVAVTIVGVAATPLNYARESLASPLTLTWLVGMLDEGSPIARFLALADVFMLWWIAVLAIGVAVLYRMSIRRVAAGLYAGSGA